MRGMSDVGSSQDVARPPEPSELSGGVHGSFNPDARIEKGSQEDIGAERGDVDARGMPSLISIPMRASARHQGMP